MFTEDTPKHSDPSVEQLLVDFKKLRKIINAVRSGSVTKAQAMEYEVSVNKLLNHAGTVDRVCKERVELLDGADKAVKKLEQFAEKRFPADGEFGYLMVVELDESMPGGERIFIGGGKRKPGEVGEPYEPSVYVYWDVYLYGYADGGPHDRRINSLREIKVTNEQLRKFVEAAESLTR